MISPRSVTRSLLGLSLLLVGGAGLIMQVINPLNLLGSLLYMAAGAFLYMSSTKHKITLSPPITHLLYRASLLDTAIAAQHSILHPLALFTFAASLLSESEMKLIAAALPSQASAVTRQGLIHCLPPYLQSTIQMLTHTPTTHIDPPVTPILTPATPIDGGISRAILSVLSGRLSSLARSVLLGCGRVISAISLPRLLDCASIVLAVDLALPSRLALWRTTVRAVSGTTAAALLGKTATGGGMIMRVCVFLAVVTAWLRRWLLGSLSVEWVAHLLRSHIRCRMRSRVD